MLGVPRVETFASVTSTLDVAHRIAPSAPAGTLVLASDAYLLSNEALQLDRQPVLLSWLLGAHADIEFDESHLGVIEDRGIAALARQYGLGAAMILLVVAAGLFSWHRMALFVPPAPERTEVALRYQQTAGLEALLQRAIAPGELATACSLLHRGQSGSKKFIGAGQHLFRRQVGPVEVLHS